MSDLEDHTIESAPLPSSADDRAAASSFDDEMHSDMSEVFDKLEGKNAERTHEEAVLKSPEESPKASSFNDAWEKTYDFLAMPEKERAERAAIRNEIDAVKEFANENGLTFEQAQALRQTAMAQERAAPQNSG